MNRPVDPAFAPAQPGTGVAQPVLSILLPVFNERATVHEILTRVLGVPFGEPVEIVVVDDGSSDGTAEVLQDFTSRPNVTVVRHSKNRGKGAAIRTALAQARGRYLVIQDADLEVNPQDIPRLVRLAQRTGALACFGARFMGDNRRFYALSTYWANRLLTLIFNFLNAVHLNDMNTCYKLLRADLARKIGLRSNGFAMEPEIASKITRLGIQIRELSVQYHPRMKKEGKKIRAVDFFRYLLAMLKYRFWQRPNDQ